MATNKLATVVDRMNSSREFWVTYGILPNGDWAGEVWKRDPATNLVRFVAEAETRAEFFILVMKIAAQHGLI